MSDKIVKCYTCANNRECPVPPEDLTAPCRSYEPSGEITEPFDVEPSEFHDAVGHPSHYCQGGIECIDAIRASMPPDQFAGYCKGNCMKYIWRYNHKNGLEDLEKAYVYLGWMIEAVKNSQ